MEENDFIGRKQIIDRPNESKEIHIGKNSEVIGILQSFQTVSTRNLSKDTELKAEYFNNFNQVPKAVLQQIVPTKLSKSPMKINVINKKKVENKNLKLETIQEKQIKSNFDPSPRDDQMSEEEHKKIRSSNKNIFNTIVGNIDKTLGKSISFVNYYI